jgi:DNA-directed RNA polymerase specialized sigma24 family protein
MGAIALDFMAMLGERPKREFVDFSSVPVSQWRIHDRLENWARWARGSQRQSGTGSPMFSLYRSSDAKRAYGEDTSIPVDPIDAQAVAKGVAALPDKHRRAIHWNYLHPRNPSGAARELGVSLQGLADLVRNGRQMLLNRGI